MLGVTVSVGLERWDVFNCKMDGLARHCDGPQRRRSFKLRSRAPGGLTIASVQEAQDVFDALDIQIFIVQNDLVSLGFGKLTGKGGLEVV
jgi:hypothetical protein